MHTTTYMDFPFLLMSLDSDMDLDEDSQDCSTCVLTGSVQAIQVEYQEDATEYMCFNN